MQPKPPVFIVPGWGNSGPNHWQTLWERAHPEYRRIEQREWEQPDRREWLAILDAAIIGAPQPPILVAHSLGCIAIAHWANERGLRFDQRIAAAMLVAPADVEALMAPEPVHGFRPVPLMPLECPSVVVASRTDDYVSFDRAAMFAKAWGSELVDVGDAGHINTDAGYGAWPDGERILRDLINRVT
jgi:predicted alpha/beta hydrolase family esterase